MGAASSALERVRGESDDTPGRQGQIAVVAQSDRVGSTEHAGRRQESGDDRDGRGGGAEPSPPPQDGLERFRNRTPRPAEDPVDPDGRQPERKDDRELDADVMEPGGERTHRSISSTNAATVTPSPPSSRSPGRNSST